MRSLPVVPEERVAKPARCRFGVMAAVGAMAVRAVPAVPVVMVA